jgi:signal transduction histidine kinase/PAS domain-containing protein
MSRKPAAAGGYTRTVVSTHRDESPTGSVWPSWRIFTLSAVVVVWLGVAASRIFVTWRGDAAELLLLIGGNTLVSVAGAWLFHLRWLATGSLHDRRIRNAYIPMAVYFACRFAVAPIGIPSSTLVAADWVAWLLAQAASVMVLLLPVHDETWATEKGQAVRSAVAIAAALSITAMMIVLKRIGLLVGVQPAEIGLSVAFAFASAMLLIWRRNEGRDLWLGVAMMLVAGSHIVLALSRTPYDSSVMWGLLLFCMALSVPIVGATCENATRLLDQDAMHDRLTRLRRRTEIILDTLPAMVLSVDRDRRLHYANGRARASLLIPHEIDEDSRLSWLDRIHPHDRPQVNNAVVSVLDRPGGVWEGVIRTEDPGGGVHWLSTQMHQVVDPSANQTLVQVVATEVTDLYLAQRSAEAQQSRLAFLSNLAQSMAGEVEEERILDRYLEIGQQVVPMKALLLYRPFPGSTDLRLVAAAGPGTEVFDRHRNQPLEGEEHPCRLAFQTGVPRSAELAEVVSRSDAALLGSEHDIRHLGFLPLLAAGGVIGVVVTASSIQPKLAAEDMDLMTQIGFLLGGTIYVAQLVRELNEQRAVAFEASRLKSEFLANTSHELRTPLTAILGFLRLVIDGTIDDIEKQREYLTIAHDSAEKLLTIINDVLDLAKIEAGRLEVHQGPVPVRAVLESVETLFKHQMKNKGVGFTISLSNPGLVLWADPDRTTQILTNLLSNAMKFTPRNGSINVDCNEDGDTIVFTVVDSGVGIPEGEVEKVFSSFYQVDGSTTREHGGTGLGLTISRRLAELMGGTLGLESEGHERGTTARFQLPAYHDDSPPAENHS